MKYFLYSLMMVIVGACQEDQGKLKHVELNEGFILAVGHTAILSEEDGLSIQLVRVEDSRCPDNSGINCVWVGQAVVYVKLEPEVGEMPESDLNTFNKKELLFNGLKIELVDVTPYPKSTSEDNSKKIATFRVTRP